MAETLKIYTNPISSNSKRVRVLAGELGLATEEVPIDFAKGEHRAPDFLEKNPNGKLPVVELDGRYRWESPSIVIDLAQRHQSPLYPEPGPEQSEVLKWMFWNASHLEPAIFAAIFEVVFKPRIPDAEFDQKRYAQAEGDFTRFATVLDSNLANRSWIAGGSFTVADIVIGTTVENADSGRLSLEPFPHIVRWLNRLAARPSWGAKSLAA